MTNAVFYLCDCFGLAAAHVYAMINSFHQTITGDSIACDAEFDSDSRELHLDCVITGVEFDY